MSPGIKVLPTKNLAMLIVRAMKAGKINLNYAVGFKDVNGYGLSIGKVDWLNPGDYYINL